MSVEKTRETITAYVNELLSFGSYADYLADDVVLTIMGTDQGATGREAVRQMIDFFHSQAFKTDIQIKNTVYGDNKATAEAEFIGTHIGEFAGIAASGKQVNVPYSVAYDLEDDRIKALRLYFPMDVLVRQIS